MEKLSVIIKGMKESITKLTSDLAMIKTVNPPGEKYGEILDLLESQFKQLDMETERITSPKEEGLFPRENLLARWNLGKDKTLHLNGHIDVVPAEDSWHPFNPRVEGDWLIGRGTSDMKSGFSCYIHAIRAIKETGIEPKVNIEVSCTADEETGGRQGLGYLTENGHITADYALGEGASGKSVCIGNKGMAWFEITVIGKAAHGAYPYKGINSFEIMNRLVAEIQELASEIRKRKTKYNVEDERDGYATIEMGGRVEGGKKTNILPQKTTFTIDRRVLPDENLDEAVSEIKKIIDMFQEAHPEVKIEVKITKDNSVLTDPDSQFCKELCSCVEEILGGKARPILTSGGTDMRHLINKGIKSLGYNAYGENFHGDNEKVSIKSMVDTTRIIANLIMRLT